MFPVDAGPDAIAWENQPRAGWDEFQRARRSLLLGLAVDSVIASAVDRLEAAPAPAREAQGA